VRRTLTEVRYILVLNGRYSLSPREVRDLDAVYRRVIHVEENGAHVVF
jgi:hypothetical protein